MFFSTGDEKGIGGGSIQIRRSKDMAEWELLGTVFEHIPDWVARELGGWPPNLWAPDIALVNGTYYLYYVGSTFGSNNPVIGLATNTTLDPASPDYKWVDHGMVLRSISSNNWNAIDPSLVSDADGGWWLVFGSYWDGIKMRKIDAATSMLDKNDTQLYRWRHAAAAQSKRPRLSSARACSTCLCRSISAAGARPATTTFASGERKKSTGRSSAKKARRCWVAEAPRSWVTTRCCAGRAAKPRATKTAPTPTA